MKILKTLFTVERCVLAYSQSGGGRLSFAGLPRLFSVRWRFILPKRYIPPRHHKTFYLLLKRACHTEIQPACSVKKNTALANVIEYRSVRYGALYVEKYGSYYSGPYKSFCWLAFGIPSLSKL